VFLGDLTVLSDRCHGFESGGLEAFLRDDNVRALGWPDEVVKQWLFDFASWGPFLNDYGHIDLTTLRWSEELLPAKLFLTMVTGPSDGDLLDYFAADAERQAENRRSQGVPQYWERKGTWMSNPLIIDRRLVDPPAEGLQVIEGRTRVGILRGYLALGRQVAPAHTAWVARPIANP
jgi:hypothetical protein